MMVRQVYDVKGIDMGNGLVRYKAEIDFDGRELARSYLARQDLAAVLADCNQVTNLYYLLTVVMTVCAGEQPGPAGGVPPEARGADGGLSWCRGGQNREEPEGQASGSEACRS